MRRTIASALAAAVVLVCALAPAGATSRIKDLANIEGVRQNQLIGYGLVVGLSVSDTPQLTDGEPILPDSVNELLRHP